MEGFTGTIIMGLSTFMVGSVVGYYKSRFDSARELSSYVKKEECQQCAIVRANKTREVDLRLDAGSASMANISTDIAVIKNTMENIEKEIQRIQTVAVWKGRKTDGIDS